MDTLPKAMNNEFNNDFCCIRFYCKQIQKVWLLDLPHATDYGVVIRGLGLCLKEKVLLPINWVWEFEFDLTKRQFQH